MTKTEDQLRDYKREMEVAQLYAVHGIITDVEAELLGAVQNFPPMVSYHEGFAILNEEVDELWDLVKASKPDWWYKRKGFDVVPSDHKKHMREEALQIAAMAARFALELT